MTALTDTSLILSDNQDVIKMYFFIGLFLLLLALFQKLTGFRFKSKDSNDMPHNSFEQIASIVTAFAFLGYSGYLNFFYMTTEPLSFIYPGFLFVLLYHLAIRTNDFIQAIKNGKLQKLRDFAPLIFAVLILVSFSIYIVYQNLNEPAPSEISSMNTQNFFNRLAPYVPKSLTNEFDRSEIENHSDGSVYYHWSRREPSNNKELLYSVEVNMGVKELLNYTYQDNGYAANKLQPVNWTKEVATEMVNNFAKEFYKDATSLNFQNVPAYAGLYNANHIESWIAKRADTEYLIIVNLDYGYVIYSGTAIAPNTYLFEQK